MINFREIEINDKKWMKPLLVTADMSGCHQNFTNIYAWSKIYDYRIAQMKDYLVVKGVINATPYYFYPAGSGDIKTVFEGLQQDADFCGHEFVLAGVSPENMEVMQRIFPSTLSIKRCEMALIMFIVWTNLSRCPGINFMLNAIILTDLIRLIMTGVLN